MGKIDSIIHTEALTKIFNRKKIAVNDLYLDVPPNAIYGFMGPNGAGKTTTIKMILGLIQPSAGSIQVLGEKMKKDSAKLRRKIGYLPTNPKFPEKMSPIKYLNFVGKIFGIPKETRIPRITELIRSIDLLNLSSSEIKKFSTGETTRVGIAACLINDPKLLILDEPTLGLDPIGRASTVNLITELGKNREKNVFLSSHILGDIDRICTHVGIINEGKLIFNGTITEVKRLIRSNSVELQIDGKSDSIIQKLKIIPNVIAVDIERHFIQVGIDSRENYTKTLPHIFNVFKNDPAELISFKSGSENLENAFLKLLEDEKSNGFLRGITKNL
ncbi:ABC transporter ATP-binding protein [Promethearchaeum syntrophicum]|uniref:ABC transporter ATP-binding protein n=1 Tax=Promethearchaeum syntrophicum TaxID=2594042 RepID=A0A5B9DGV5_9ARCH|nr:ABC transporter ATP-binding protein [Candidatus Prometheoarchaeum syntrophicum]QEE17963.1 Cobalamin import ATP-binding protein BtuD [Candidatus Prometheoarchaeum syntrophicum]